MLKSSISAKGQVTVPMEVRDRLGLETGTVVLFEMREDGVLLRKGSLGTHPVDQIFGLLRPRQAKGALALLDEMRGPRPGGLRATPSARRRARRTSARRAPSSGRR